MGQGFVLAGEYATVTLLFSFIGLLYVIIVFLSKKVLGLKGAEEKFHLELKSLTMGIVVGIAVSIFVAAFQPIYNATIKGEINSSLDNYTSNAVDVIKQLGYLYTDYTDLAALSIGYSITHIVSYSRGHSNYFYSLYNLASLASAFALRISSMVVYMATLYNFMKFSMWLSQVSLLPVGIALRLFPPLKRVGSTLLAVGLGLYVIYPISMYIALPLGYSLSSLSSQASASLSALRSTVSSVTSLTKSPKSLLEWLMGVDYSTNYLTLPGGEGLTPVGGEAFVVITNLLGSSIKTGEIIYHFISTSKDRIKTTKQGISALNAVLPYASSSVIATIFVAFLVVFSVLAGIRSLAIALGGEFFLYGVQSRV